MSRVCAIALSSSELLVCFLVVTWTSRLLPAMMMGAEVCFGQAQCISYTCNLTRNEHSLKTNTKIVMKTNSILKELVFSVMQDKNIWVLLRDT